MWILLFVLTWPDGEIMKLKTQVLGGRHDCEMMAKEVLDGEDLQQAITDTGATVKWECKLQEE